MKEEKDKEKLLRNILRLQAKEAEWGAKASERCTEYYRKYSEFKQGDKVILKLWDGKEKFGIIYRGSFNTHDGFRYLIKPKGKDWSDKTNRQAFYHFSTWRNDSKEVKNIEKQSNEINQQG